jgi:phosphonate transport system substrate-binding protein
MKNDTRVDAAKSFLTAITKGEYADAMTLSKMEQSQNDLIEGTQNLLDLDINSFTFEEDNEYVFVHFTDNEGQLKQWIIKTVRTADGYFIFETDFGKEEPIEVAKEEPIEVNIGIVFENQLSSSEERGAVEPLADYIEEALGENYIVTFVVEKTYKNLIKKAEVGKIDAMFISASSYVQYKDRANIEMVVKAIRFGSSSYKGQFAVLYDSPYDTIEDLADARGLIWAYPNKQSTSGYIYPRVALHDYGAEDIFETLYGYNAGSHQEAIIALLTGDADFATTYVDARVRLREEYPNVDDRVKVIGYTDPIPNDGFAIVSSINSELKEKLKNAMLQLPENKKAFSSLIEYIQWEGVDVANDSEYDIVRRALNIN